MVDMPTFHWTHSSRESHTRVVNERLTKTPRLSRLLSAARQELADRRAADAAARRLAAELAGYSTPAERNDLNALLDSHPDAEAAEIRELLNRRTAA